MARVEIMEKYQPGEHDKTAGVLKPPMYGGRLFNLSCRIHHDIDAAVEVGGPRRQELQRPGKYHCGQTQTALQQADSGRKAMANSDCLKICIGKKL